MLSVLSTYLIFMKKETNSIQILLLSVLYSYNKPHYNIPWGPPGVLGIWGEWLIIFRELGSTGNNLRGAREQAHNFGDIGSLAKKQKKIKKNKEKPPFCLIFKNNLLLLGG